MSVIYHYTDTARLPWILQDGVLRPGRNTLGGFPDPDFLWATTMPIPDATASSGGQGALAALKDGRTRTVRLTLNASDFQGWPDVTAGYPAWTPSEVKRLEKIAYGGSNPKHWRCRAKALPREAWLAVETRGFRDREWTAIDPHTELLDLGDGALGLWIGELAYFSGQIPQPNGNMGYTVFVGRRTAA
ncbi:hypothetical protein MKK75_10185 [Methylobacterium sp. J-030]|uniref:hypothetical protein n=1 Tax=Methylobacterium sp. J-030 TaxID=2836627 RepID=UPI001FB935F7|nr:hypothetical protein [Methylobacterium sp. J-030]MCJ2069167.1 hypothetical protein [Methylobacterium sp. J-030]